MISRPAQFRLQLMNLETHLRLHRLVLTRHVCQRKTALGEPWFCYSTRGKETDRERKNRMKDEGEGERGRRQVRGGERGEYGGGAVSYTHLRAHET